MRIYKHLIMAGFCVLGLSVTGEAKAANTNRSCSVDSIAVIEARMHIKCVPIPGQGITQAISYYAMNLEEGPAKIESIIMLAIASKQSKKPMTLVFDYDDYKSVPGCQGSNCRVLKGAAME